VDYADPSPAHKACLNPSQRERHRDSLTVRTLPQAERGKPGRDSRGKRRLEKAKGHVADPPFKMRSFGTQGPPIMERSLRHFPNFKPQLAALTFSSIHYGQRKVAELKVQLAQTLEELRPEERS
jgi:hypothetical protein